MTTVASCSHVNALAKKCHLIVCDKPINQRYLVDSGADTKTLASSLDSEYTAILRDFPDLTKPRPFNEKIKHNTFHYFETFGPPAHARARMLNPQQSEAAKQEFQYMLDQGIIIPSKSNRCSPLYMVSKKDANSWRPCGDYHALNKQTQPDRYSIPNLTSFNENLKAHPSEDADLTLMIDASDFGLGASLNEITSDGFKPLGFSQKN
ncbi:transposon Ty3-G gap-Pol polyprotein [Trichonephila clavipes]|nr:transposon Ty3-G gap-Pol polyprotein [Trichonephila clavipes]